MYFAGRASEPASEPTDSTPVIAAAVSAATAKSSVFIYVSPFDFSPRYADDYESLPLIRRQGVEMRGAGTSPAPLALHHVPSQCFPCFRCFPCFPCLPPTLESCVNAWNSAARTIFVVAGPAVGQSVALAGSASCSPRKFGPPVHWFVLTTRRRWVAFVFGMSNERRIRFGDTGRGELPGKASAPLV